MSGWVGFLIWGRFFVAAACGSGDGLDVRHSYVQHCFDDEFWTFRVLDQCDDDSGS